MLRRLLPAPFAYIGEHPKVVIAAGWFCGVTFLFMSLFTGKWHWFPRGGAVMALCGFIVAVRETLLWRPYRPVETKPEPAYAAGDLVRADELGLPLFYPRPNDDPEMTQEETDQDYAARLRAWEDAENYVVVRAGDAGRPIRDTSQFTVEELARLRHSSILGVLGTFIWAFGDLLGGLPRQ